MIRVRAVARVASMAILVGVAAAPSAWGQGPAAGAENRPKVGTISLAGIDAMVQGGAVPDSALPRVAAFIRSELERAMDAAPAPVTADKLPILGDEVTPARLKAEPGIAGRPFVMSGALKFADVRAPGEGEGGDYAFTLVSASPDMKWTGDRVAVRVSRLRGGSLARMVAGLADSRPGVLMPVRLQCTASQDGIAADDWQTPTQDGLGWRPWAFRGIDRGFTAIGMASRPGATRALLDIILDERPAASPEAEKYVKGMAILTMLEMPARDRQAAAKLAATRGKRTRSESARAWARTAIASLARGELVGL
jgi:hypothetical protein